MEIKYIFVNREKTSAEIQLFQNKYDTEEIRYSRIITKVY